jgi:hypothetical protein
VDRDKVDYALSRPRLSNKHMNKNVMSCSGIIVSVWLSSKDISQPPLQTTSSFLDIFAVFKIPKLSPANCIT